MLSIAESDKKKANADISMKLGKNVHEHDLFEYLLLANRNCPFQNGGTKIQDGRQKNRQIRK